MLTIASPNTDRTLLTTAELRSAAGVTDSSRDVELTALGDYIAAVITNACQVVRVGATPPTLRLESVVETFHRRGHNHHSNDEPLVPSRRPVASITSVVEGTATLDASSYEIDGTLLYRLSGTRRGCWRHGPVVVSYDAGWATVPNDLRYAAIRFVQGALVQGDRDPMLKRKVTVGVSEYEWWVDPTKDNIVPLDVMDILINGGYVNRWAWL
jgi:hypothetical protein